MPAHRRALLKWFASALPASALGAAHAQRPSSTPSAEGASAARPPLRLIVAYQVGGQVDLTTRAVAKPLSQALGGRRVVVENMAGNSAKTAIAHVAHLPPDGNTLLVVMGHALPALAALSKQLPFNPRHDLQIVSELAYNGKLLVAHHSLPIYTVRDLLLYTRANLHSASMGSLGEGSTSHVVQAYLSHQMGAPVRYVPYPGEAPILKDLLAGKVNLALLSPTLLKPHTQSNKIQVIAAMSPVRNPLFPNVPTMLEQGYHQPLFHLEPPISVFAPKGTPAALVTELGDAFFNAVHTPAFKQMADDNGIRRIGSRTPQAQKHFEHDYPIIQELTELSGATAN